MGIFLFILSGDLGGLESCGNPDLSFPVPLSLKVTRSLKVDAVFLYCSLGAFLPFSM
jgi:hypothetical protein